MANLEWHDFYNFGIDFIDDDHRQLLEVMRSIQDAIKSGDMDKSATLLEDLMTLASQHFKREEAFLAKISYPGLEEHKKYHQLLLVQANHARLVCQSTEASHNVEDCFNSLAKFLIDDILGGDIQFKSYLEERGLVERAFYVD